MAKIRHALELSNILGLINSLYRRLGAIRETRGSQVSVVTKQNREINWHAIKAVMEDEKEMERRKWELWGIYGRR